jgi:hypothetical protein
MNDDLGNQSFPESQEPASAGKRSYPLGKIGFFLSLVPLVGFASTLIFQPG